MQAPGGPEEDTSGGFKYGGWVAPYFDDVGGKVMEKTDEPADLLWARKTFEIFASYWPEHADFGQVSMMVTKYVMSKTLKKSDPIAIGWKNSVFLKSLTDIEKLKNSKVLTFKFTAVVSLFSYYLRMISGRTLAQNLPIDSW